MIFKGLKMILQCCMYYFRLDVYIRVFWMVASMLLWFAQVVRESLRCCRCTYSSDIDFVFTFVVFKSFYYCIICIYIYIVQPFCLLCGEKGFINKLDLRHASAFIIIAYYSPWIWPLSLCPYFGISSFLGLFCSCTVLLGS